MAYFVVHGPDIYAVYHEAQLEPKNAGKLYGCQLLQVDDHIDHDQFAIQIKLGHRQGADHMMIHLQVHGVILSLGFPQAKQRPE